jgi:hypothetical protein
VLYDEANVSCDPQQTLGRNVPWMCSLVGGQVGQVGQVDARCAQSTATVCTPRHVEASSLPGCLNPHTRSVPGPVPILPSHAHRASNLLAQSQNVLFSTAAAPPRNTQSLDCAELFHVHLVRSALRRCTRDEILRSLTAR